MSIPCNIIVPGNQQKAPNVYSLTECYYATVCIDQPVAADAIAPPTPQEAVGSADPGTTPRSASPPSNNNGTKFKDDGFPDPAPGLEPKGGNAGPKPSNAISAGKSSVSIILTWTDERVAMANAGCVVVYCVYY